MASHQNLLLDHCITPGTRTPYPATGVHLTFSKSKVQQPLMITLKRVDRCCLVMARGMVSQGKDVPKMVLGTGKQFVRAVKPGPYCCHREPQVGFDYLIQEL